MLSTPLVRALKRAYPTCRIDVLTFAGTEAAFEGNPDIDRVITTAEDARPAQTLRQAIALWRRYDLAVIAQTGTRPFFFGWAAGRRRIGLVAPEPGRSWWKRALLDGYAVFDGHAPRVLENQRIVELLGVEESPVVVPPTAHWTAAEVSDALGFDARERFAVVHPSPRWRYKQWTTEGWRALIAALAAQGLRVVITGGPDAGERSYVDAVLNGVEPHRLLRADGRWTFAQTADILRYAAVYIGPGHRDDASRRGLRHADGRALRSDGPDDLGAVAGSRGARVRARRDAPAAGQRAAAAEPRAQLRAVPARRLRATSRQLLAVPRPARARARRRRCVRPVAADRHDVDVASLRRTMHATDQAETRINRPSSRCC